jgi:hypothetical protein
MSVFESKQQMITTELPSRRKRKQAAQVKSNEYELVGDDFLNFVLVFGIVLYS